MQRLFKHLRYQLFQNGRSGRYFKYAIGEIILVLIGILLALSISDWNNKRLEKQKELTTLIELKKGILIDLDLVSEGLKSVTKSVTDLEYLQSIITDQQYSYNKGLDTLFGTVWGMRILKPNNAFYEDLKSSGLNLIKDDSIRFQIVQLFETNYSWLNWINELEMSINEVNRPYYLEHFNSLVFSKQATPNNFNEIWNDQYYHNIIDYRRITLDNQVQNYGTTEVAIKRLVEDIDKYLNE